MQRRSFLQKFIAGVACLPIVSRAEWSKRVIANYSKEVKVLADFRVIVAKVEKGKGFEYRAWVGEEKNWPNGKEIVSVWEGPWEKFSFETLQKESHRIGDAVARQNLSNAMVKEIHDASFPKSAFSDLSSAL